MRETGLSMRPRDLLVFEAWTGVLGETMSKRAIPVRFRDGELLVEVQSAVHLQELKNFTGDQYRQKANAKLDGPVIRRLTFKLRG
jgi:hypothetical protein